LRKKENFLANSSDIFVPRTYLERNRSPAREVSVSFVKMFFAPPIYYDELMKKVPKGKLITVSVMRDYLAKTNNADFTDPMTAGIFVNIVAWASYQRDEDITPYWRTLKSDGELNVKYPEGKELQKRLLEEEGHTIISKGTKNIKYYVKDFENSLIEL